MATQNKQPAGRYTLVDFLRGLALVNMVAYHALWDLVYLFQWSVPWYQGPVGRVWQQCICWLFILLSGFCWGLGRHTLRRGATVFLAGGLVTLVTTTLQVGEIRFGVLTLLGSCMVLLLPLRPALASFPPAPALAGSFLLFWLCRPLAQGRLGLGRWQLALPAWLYQGPVAAYVGFRPAGLRSADYFPLLPWMFLFLCGFFLLRCCRVYLHTNTQQALLRPAALAGGGILQWLGRHALPVYLAHQPLVYGGLVALQWAGLL